MTIITTSSSAVTVATSGRIYNITPSEISTATITTNISSVGINSITSSVDMTTITSSFGMTIL